MQTLLQQAGARDVKETRYAPLYINRTSGGLWTQRSPLRDPSTVAIERWYGGKPDSLLDGVNIELTNRLTLARRPGTSKYCPQNVSETINSFYAFKQFTTNSETITLMMDGPANIYTLTTAAETPMFTKAMGATNSYWLGVGNSLYIGDTAENIAWEGPGSFKTAAVTNTSLTSNLATYTAYNNFFPGNRVTITGLSSNPAVYNVSNATIIAATQTTFQVAITHANLGSTANAGTANAGTFRKWGIAVGSTNSVSEYAGTGASAMGGGGALTAGPTIAGMGADDGGVAAFWNNANNVTIGNGISFASANLPSNPITGISFTNYLEATNFGFSIPSSATINGIVAQIVKGTDGSSTDVFDGGVSLIKGGAILGNDLSDGTAWQGGNTSAATSYGSTSTLSVWGLSFAYSDINASNFGIAIRAHTPSFSGTFQCQLYSIKIIIYYTTPPIAGWANPTNIEGSPDAAYTTVTPTIGTSSAILYATNYNFSPSNPAVGVLVSITGHVGSGGASPNLSVQLQDNNGNSIGATKSLIFNSTTDVTATFGGSSDLWGLSSLTTTIYGSTNFGLQIVGQSNSVEFFLDSAEITLYTAPVPVATPTGMGSFSAINGGYQYVYEYADSQYGTYSVGSFSNALGPTVTTGNFSSDAYVSVAVVPSSDPQVNQIWVFRTKDGGATFYALPTNPYPNIPALITNTALTSNVATITAANSFLANETVTISGTTNGGGAFNVSNAVIVSATATNFTFALTHADIGTAADSGLATLTSIPDASADSSLITTELPALAGENTPPPAGLVGPVWHMGRMWGFVGNTLYYSSGGDLGNILGNGNEGWPPVNNFVYPARITRLVSTPNGLLVFTLSDVHIVYGNGSPLAAATGAGGITIFFSVPFQARYGLSYYWALDINGSLIYFMTTDGRMVSMDFSSNITEIGYPIAAPNWANLSATLQNYNAANTYVTWHTSGSTDQALFVADGATGWFRCNTNLAPDGGFVWSPMAVINTDNGVRAVQSIETSPGVWQLLIGPGASGGPILYRNLNVFSDNTLAYPANCIMGTIVLAQPGQLAEIAFVTCDFNKVGTSPLLNVLLNEVSGTFESLSGYVHQDSPYLYGLTSAPATLYSNRYDLLQTVAANSGQNPVGSFARYMQIQIDFGAADIVQNELASLTVFGSHWSEI